MVDAKLPQYLKPVRKCAGHQTGAPDAAQESISARRLALCSVPEARCYLEEQQAHRIGALPLGVVDILGAKTLTVAVAKGAKVETERALRFVVEIPVRLAEVSSVVLSEAITIAYCGDEGRLIAGVHKLREAEGAGGHLRLAQPIDFRPAHSEVGQFVAALVEFGFSKGASDIHLLPRREGVFVRMRVQGELLTNTEPLCTAAVHQQVTARIKVLAGVTYSHSAVPCDGAFRVPFGGREAQVRVSTIPTMYGEKVVLRLLGGAGVTSLYELGFDESVVAALARALEQQQGAIFVAGPTGSGKSSTLYALAARAALHGHSVCSVEDPVERVLPEISQTQIDEPRGLTFPVALRAVVRQDPNVIMVGEIRDQESARIAIQAALTGHLLLSSVHAGTVPGIIRRLRTLGVADDLLSESVALVINQRLVPILCERCKVVDLVASREVAVPRFRPVGCGVCDYAGYAGRVPIAQVWAPAAGEISSLERLERLSSSAGWFGWSGQIQALLSGGKVVYQSVARFAE